MKTYLEIKFWQLAIHLIRKGYGADCPDKAVGCVSCEAKDVIKWIEGHIKFI